LAALSGATTRLTLSISISDASQAALAIYLIKRAVGGEVFAVPTLGISGISRLELTQCNLGFLSAKNSYAGPACMPGGKRVNVQEVSRRAGR